MINIALITSTIAPKKSVFSLKEKDPLLRMEQYKEAFGFYITCLENKTFDKIVYVDNSGHCLKELSDLASDNGVLSQIEFISYESTIDVKNNSRFYLEINLIDYFIQNSKTLRDYPSCMIWKVTGRYIISNISEIIKNSKNGYDMYFNYRNIPEKCVDFYLVGFNESAYKKIFASQIDIYKGLTSGELILRKQLDIVEKNNLKILKRLPLTPLISGTRGWDGARYGEGKDLMKYYLRELVLRIFPFLWI